MITGIVAAGSPRQSYLSGIVLMLLQNSLSISSFSLIQNITSQNSWFTSIILFI